MLGLAADHDAQFVAMHNLGLPADRERILPTGTSAADQVEAWLDARLERWTSAGLRLDRIIFDPGIGFGKNAVQSLDLLRNIGRFTQKPVRLLVGHSRKSFMHDFVSQAVHERDLVTIGGSMALIESGVDILRVHNVPDHVLAARGLAQFAAPA
jgi:dihydropteroate synthase